MNRCIHSPSRRLRVAYTNVTNLLLPASDLVVIVADGDDRGLAHEEIGVGILRFLECCHRNMFSQILHQINDVIPMKIFLIFFLKRFYASCVRVVLVAAKKVIADDSDFLWHF